MGLYIKLQRNYDTIEDSMLILYQMVIERLVRYFNFKPIEDYTLWYGDFDEKELNKSKDLEIKSLQSLVESHRAKIREKTGIYSHYSISVEGIIELYKDDKTKEKVIIDVLGTCTQFKDLYGNVWIEFYNASKKWQNYFIGGNEVNEINRDGLYSLMNDIIVPDLRIYTIFFAESNIVFDLLNKAYYIYFRDYKFFIETIVKILEDRLNEKNLEYENLLISDVKRPLIPALKNDLKLLNTNELVSIIDRKTSDFSNNFESYVSHQYKGMITYTTASSVIIKDRSMDEKRIRSTITDFVGNFLSTLYNTLPKYNDVEKRIKKEFTTHRFQPEKGKKQMRF